jgi:UDP-apiose/xylose synthase
VTIRELALLMRRLYVEITGDRSYADHPILETSSREFYGEGYEDCDRRMPSIDKARSLLGWQPEIGLEALMTETMNYYHEHYGPSVQSTAGLALAASADSKVRLNS